MLIWTIFFLYKLRICYHFSINSCVKISFVIHLQCIPLTSSLFHYSSSQTLKLYYLFEYPLPFHSFITFHYIYYIILCLFHFLINSFLYKRYRYSNIHSFFISFSNFFIFLLFRQNFTFHCLINLYYFTKPPIIVLITLFTSLL